MNTSIKLVLDSKPLADGQHKIYLRITKDRKTKKIALGINCKKEHFINEALSKAHKHAKQDNLLLTNLKARAAKILRDYDNEGISYTLDDFETKFKLKPSIKDYKISDFYDEIIDELERSGRMSYAKSFKDTRTSFLKYAGENFCFKDVNPVVIEKYEVFLRETKNQNGGIAFKMRHLRALFNIAIKRKVMSKNNYSFDVYKISKLKPENNKRALTIEEFKKVRDVDLSERPDLVESHKFFLFSVYTRGMNFADMAKLKWTDIINDRIIYKRSKTKKSFNLEITDVVMSILTYFKNQERNSNFVFPILLKDDLTPKQIANRKHKVLSRHNKKLKEIANLAEVNQNLTTYVARHSFATILKILGTSVDKISEMMGHSNVEITMSYLKDFDNNDLDLEVRKLENL